MDDEGVTYERLVQINAMVGAGTAKPANLTPAEDAEWDSAVRFYARARKNGWTVMLPSETSGTF